MPNSNETIYLESLKYVLKNGKPVKDRTGVGTLRCIGVTNRYNLDESFPLLTTKKLDLASISSELVWFVEGSGDERRLAEIRYGKPRAELTTKKTIWTDNAKAPYWTPKAKFEGDLGRVYGTQWRAWRVPVSTEFITVPIGVTTTYSVSTPLNPFGYKMVDQLFALIEGLKNDPYGRRHILTAWNPGEISDMALPPCHIMSQFFVEDDKLSCSLYQRSCDKFLGEPYNVASYALFTHMIAQVCGYGVGDLIHTQGDSHIYLDHIEAVEEQLSREVRTAPILTIDPAVDTIEGFGVESFKLLDYEPHPAIKAKMAV